ncbi:MAG: hypothetical protein HDT18_00265 [Oscillibacter sp.]|nr:hypothetical protein [Oscillibacter sp.]
MKPEELKEYLGIVVDMEQNIFMQGQIIDQWEREIAELGKANRFQEPPHPQEKPLPERPGAFVSNVPPPPTPPVKPKIIRYSKKAFKIMFFVGLLYAVCMLCSGMITNPAALVGALIGCVLMGIIVAAITAVIVFFFSNDGTIQEYYNQKKQYTAAAEQFPAILARQQQYQQEQWKQECEKIQQSNQAAMCEYQKKLDAYHSAIAEDRHRVTVENIKKDVLEAELFQMRTQNAESKAVLLKIYSKNIIFPKYRTMVMVCSLYEYVCSGRCDTLEGHEGAYNILEMEIRLDKIVTQLDRVILMLGKIQQSQYMIYSAIQSANHQAAKILESTYQMTNQLQALQSSNQQMLGDIQAGIQKGILATERHSASTTQMTRQLSALQASSALTAYQSERTQKELHYMNRMNYLSGKNDDVFFNIPPV